MLRRFGLSLYNIHAPFLHSFAFPTLTDKAPYIVYVEVLEIENRHTSPVPPKLLESNTLRYTRSEENLPDYFSRMELNSAGGSGSGSGSGNGSGGSVCGLSVNSDQTSMSSSMAASASVALSAASAKPDSYSVYSAPDVDDADCWSQEDDDIYISFQVIISLPCDVENLISRDILSC